MRVGFHLVVGRNEQTRLAFRLADLAADLGHDVSFLSNAMDLPRRLSLLSPRWYNKIVRESVISLPDWVSGRDLVVWPCQVQFDCVNVVGRSGAGSVILLDSLYMSEDDGIADAYRAADIVVTTGKNADQLADDNWGLANTRCIPWDTGNPIIKKTKLTRSDGKVSVIIPFHDELTNRISSSILNDLATMLQLWPFLNITVPFCRKTLRGWVVGHLRKLVNKYKGSGRLQLMRIDRLSYTEYQSLLIQSDLCILPIKSDFCGVTAMESLCAGTPVICYDIAPMSEIVYHNVNGALVPCDLEYTWFGTPKAKDHSFIEVVGRVLSEVALLEKLNAGTDTKLVERRRNFESSWGEIFDMTQLKE